MRARHSELSTSRFRFVLATLMLALAAALFVSITRAGLPLERGLQTFRDSIAEREASGRFVLVEIDARSLARLDKWPWPRSVYARALDRLERSGAEMVAFDIDFSARSTTAEDEALRKAIERTRIPVMLPVFLQHESSAGGKLLETRPIAQFSQKALLAAVNITADDDGLARQYPYGIMLGGIPRPSFAASLAGISGRAGATFAIDGAIDPDTVPRVSFVDLIEGRFGRHDFRGKGVIIGGTAIELGDRFAVPRHGVIPGPVIQTLAAETLLSGSTPTDWGPAPAILVAVLTIAVGAGRRAMVCGGAAATGTVMILLLPLAMKAMHWGSVSIVPGLAALATGVAVCVIAHVVASLREARLIDSASGLPNRTGFNQAMTSAGAVTITAMRIANFGEIATTLGHDRTVQLVGRIVDRLGVAQVGEVYRLDSSLFAWSSKGLAGDQDFNDIDAIAALMRPAVEVGGRLFEVRCHFGIASGSGNAGTIADHAILAADHAVRTGTRCESHSSGMSEKNELQLALTAELDQALAAGDIWVAYQPKFDFAAGEVVSAEALVRWDHPTRGMIRPDTFIPLLEANGRILDLTLYVLARASAESREWTVGGEPFRVAVNASALLAADPQFLQAIEDMIAMGALDPNRLTLEITESAALADTSRAVEALDQIAGHGIKLSIDDYGTGQSTLSYLKTLPASEIKIDKSFVSDMERNPSDQAMVRSTIELAHQLGYSVVAEGVETQTLLQLLGDMGCDTAQGWQIGKPTAATEFASRFADRKAVA